MQSYLRIALQAILLAGIVHGSSDELTPISRNIGEHFEAAVTTSFDNAKQCNITTPSNNVIMLKPNDESDDKYELLGSSDDLGCRVRVLNLDENDVGIWTIRTLSTAGNIHFHSYNVNVHSTAEPDYTTTTESVDEENKSEVYKIEYLNTLRINTKLGTTHNVQIPAVGFVYSKTCYIVTPEGMRYNFEHLDIPGIEIINNEYVACNVKLNLNEEEQIGQWMLISRETSLLTGAIQERRLQFIIKVTEEVNAIPNKITVIQNKNLFVRLENEIPDPETCKLLRPYGTEYENYEIDPRHHNACGFIVREVNETDNGTWEIVYGHRITYRAPFQVTVLTNGEHGQSQSFTWIRDKPVQQIFGSESAIYCKIMDPKNLVIFEGFGRCNITLPRATFEHEGTWKMFVGVEGRVLTEESTFTVEIVNEPPKAQVKTVMTADRPVLTLSCSVSSPYPIHACKFRDPTGRILMANHGVGEDRYRFYGNGSSYESGVYNHDCGIQITDPLVRDLGFWRCAIETSEETYFGFLTAWTHWLTRDPEVAAGILTERTLTADRTFLDSIEGDNVLMSCSVQSAIRYCYFRAPNATVYTVGPGFSSTDMADYAGAGLDAGECSIRFRSLDDDGSGMWRCQVGFFEPDMPEQIADIQVIVREIMVVSQISNAINVRVKGRQLDYCRFVRNDGFGFTSDAVPYQYEIEKIWLKVGKCNLLIRFPDEMDRQPWTVVARIAGQSREITRTTNGAPLERLPPGNTAHSRLQTLWLVFLVSGIMMIVLGLMVGSKKNRNWTYTRAASIRQSFRQRFAKKAVVEANVSNNNTANAA